MYSVVLATMLTATSVSPTWCHGCWGCHGCYRCCGGCYGCCGCCGGCWGCYGCGGGWGCYGCGCYGCYGCGGGWGCYGCGGVVVAPVAVAAPAAATTTTTTTTRREETRATSAPATVVVQVPADADLFVDNQRSQLSTTTRKFVSPALEPGQDYYYDLRVEALRDGRVVRDSKRVTIRAGSVARVDFRDSVPGEVTAAAPAEITVRLPAEARLFVDNRPCPLTSRVRTFTTPKLEPGRSFYYTLKAEVEQDGQTVVDSQRVVVQAGKKVEVTFDKLPALTRTASR